MEDLIVFYLWSKEKYIFMNDDVFFKEWALISH